MLSHLSIKHLAVVEQLELSFENGMTVFTGETGAGKSILIDALGLTLGERTDSSLVRAGYKFAEITAIYDLNRLPHVQDWLKQRDLLEGSGDQCDCIIRRNITVDGKSRAYINGHSIPLQQLKELGELLVNIHGQHQHQSLLKPDYQRLLLDEYGNHLALCRELREAYQDYQKLIKIQKELQELQGQQDKLSLLQYQIQELDELNLQENELQNLEEEQRKLNHAAEWLGICDNALNILQNEGGTHQRDVLSELNQVNALLSSMKLSNSNSNSNSNANSNSNLNLNSNLSSTTDSLKNCRDLLSQALIQLEEGCHELSHFKESISINPERLSEVESRLSQIHNLARKHRVGTLNLLQHHEELKIEAEKLLHVQAKLNESFEKIKKSQETYLCIASRLTALRQKTSLQVEKLITEKMHELEMPKGRFQVQITERSKNHFSPDGLDEIEFLVSTNPGLPLQPLRKIASGGELSRLSLAIQVITAEKSRTPTLIFDEVDVGISGKTAAIVGQLLRQLGKETQVFSVTHLPQVAANGEHHYVVEKQQEQDSTSTHIRYLDNKDKVLEIARLLGGTKITKNTIAHAEELLESS